MSRYILMLAEVRQAHGVFLPDRVMRGLKLHSGMKQVCFFTGGGSILHDTSQIRIPDPVLFYLKSYTDDFDTAS
ncbi:Host specificity protein J from prophage [Escherichia coli]|nr:Host specificity protein J from prophage [Escherichia coli]